MGRFQGFYTGEEIADDNTSFSGTEFFARKRQTRGKESVLSRQLKIWNSEFRKCSSISDYQDYIKKYNNSDNPYIVEAIEIINNSKRSAQPNNNTTNQSPPQRDQYLILRIIGTILLFVAIGLFSIVVEISGWVKYVIIGCGLPIMKWIWNKD